MRIVPGDKIHIDNESFQHGYNLASYLMRDRLKIELNDCITQLIDNSNDRAYVEGFVLKLLELIERV
jgi:hypothetical protein